ncbi:MAG: hypothetical protein BGO51_22085 [Rhodospirillales bacterium 69-11]|nr:MAG: hypothetical protein BGO51_22085 [Rhodospirillales bacterium 69-11]
MGRLVTIWHPLNLPIVHYALPEAAEAVAEVATMPFWTGGKLVRLSSPVWGAVRIYAAMMERGRARIFIHLTGNGDQVHQANGLAGLDLSEATVIPYLRFFGFFARDEGSAFLILRARQVEPFICTAVMLVDGEMRDARFAVHPDGQVETLENRYRGRGPRWSFPLKR